MVKRKHPDTGTGKPFEQNNRPRQKKFPLHPANFDLTLLMRDAPSHNTGNSGYENDEIETITHASQKKIHPPRQIVSGKNCRSRIAVANQGQGRKKNIARRRGRRRQEIAKAQARGRQI
jgi:hypothetical protein